MASRQPSGGDIQTLADLYAEGSLPPSSGKDGLSLPGLSLPGLSRSRGSSGSLTQSEQLDKMLGVPDIESLTPDQKEDWVNELKSVSLGGLSAVGSVLDVPGSMIRDMIVGENPLDQLMTPTSFGNRATGREVLEKFGMRPNVESGLTFGDTGELGRDVAGFGAEVLTDPLTYMSLGAIPFLKGTSTLTRGGRTVQASGLLEEATDVYRRMSSTLSKKSTKRGVDPEDLTGVRKVLGGYEPHKHAGRREALGNVTPSDILDDSTLKSVYGQGKLDELRSSLDPGDLNSPLGGSLKWSIPFTGAETVVSPTGGRVSTFVDQFERFVGGSRVGRLAKGAFDYGSKNLFGETGQRIAQTATRFRDTKMQEVADGWAEVAVALNVAREAVDESLGGSLLDHVGRSRRTLGADATVMDRGGVLRELRVGDFVRDTDNSGAYIAGFQGKNNQVQLLRYTKSAGEYTLETRPYKSIVDKNKKVLPERIDPSSREAASIMGASAMVDDANEVLLMKMLRMLKELSAPTKRGTGEIHDHLGKLQVRDIFPGSFGAAKRSKAWPTVKGAYFGGRFGDGITRPIQEALEALEKFESKFSARYKGKGGNMGDIGRDRFFFAPRRGTPSVRAIKSAEAREAGEGGLVQNFGGKRKTEVLEEDALSRDMDFDVAESRDPAISNLPVFVIERMLSDSPLYRGGREFVRDPLKRFDYLMDEKNGYRNYILDAVPENKIKEIATREADEAIKKKIGIANREDPEWAILRDGREEANREIFLRDMILGNPESKQRGLSEFILNWGPKTGRGKGPMFMTDFMLNYRDYFVNLAGREALHDAVLDAVANDIRITSRSERGLAHTAEEASPSTKTMTVGGVLESLGHNMEEAPGHLGPASLPQKSLETIHRMLDSQTKKFAQLPKGTGIADHLQGLAELPMSKGLAKQLLATRRVMEGGEFFEPFVKALDSMTAMFKGNVTLPFPAFASRNLLSGQFVNFASGFFRSLGDIDAYRNAIVKARKIGRDPSKHYEEVQHLRTMKIVGNQHLDDVDYVGNVESAFIGRPSADAQVTPGKFERFFDPKYWRDNWKNADDYVHANPSAYKSALGTKQSHDLNYAIDKPTQGLKQARKVNRTVLSAGSSLNQHVEFLNRAPMYYYLQDHLGFSSSQAAAEIRKLQFDYGRLTAFEKKYMRRAMPFYAFTRKMAPLFFEQLMTRPGGLQNQMIRLSRYSTDQDTVLPSWMGGTMQMQLGGGESGSKTFLSGLGLAHEDTLSYLQQFGKGTVPTLTGIGTNLLSRGNPLATTPLQMITGRQFHSQDSTGIATPASKRWPLVAGTLHNIGGRLDELVTGEPFLPSTDRPDHLFESLGLKPEASQAFESLAGGSPASRYLSTLSSLLRPEDAGTPSFAKPLKIGSGLRIETMEPYQLLRAEQDALEDLVQKEGIGAKYANAFVDRESLIAEMQRSGIMGTEFDLLPDRYKTGALSRMQLKEIARIKRETSKERRDERRGRIGIN